MKRGGGRNLEKVGECRIEVHELNEKKRKKEGAETEKSDLLVRVSDIAWLIL